MGKTKTFSKKAVSIVIAMLMMVVVATLAFSGTIASAETSGDFTYTVKDGNATITKYSGKSANVVIPSTIGSAKVTAIAKKSFSNNNTMVTLTIPETVTAIQSASSSNHSEGAFYNCTKLQSVTFSAGTKDAYIGTAAFKNCVVLLSVDIPGNYKSIGEYAFAGCTKLSSMKYNQSSYDYANQEIGNYAFSECTVLKTISLPETLNRIGRFSFYNTAIKELIIPEGVIEVGQGAFEDCTKLTSVSIPSTVTKLEGADRYDGDEGVFSDCVNLQTVTIAPSDEFEGYIGMRTFKDCVSLQTIEIPGNYTLINEEAFKGCTSLKSMKFNKSSYAYANQTIAASAFSECTALETVSLPETLNSIGAFAFYKTAIKQLVIPEGVTVISQGAFEDCANMVSVSIPSTVTKLEGADRYDGDEGIFSDCTNLQTVTIAPSDEFEGYIGMRTFKDCVSLQTIEIPGNYTLINEEAFKGCTSLKSMKFNKSSYAYANQTIAASAFSECTALETVSLPETLNSIGAFAFYKTAIKQLVIPEGVTVISQGAFEDCANIVSVSIPSTVTKLEGADRYDGDEGVFSDCTNLQTVTIAPSDEFEGYIGMRTFKDCVSLQTIEIPGNYTLINEEAFKGCTSLKSVKYNQSSYAYANQKIAASAFSGCTKLETVILPTTLGSIGDSAFYATNISVMIIPEGVTSVGEEAFKKCDDMTQVHFPVTLTSVGKNCFAGSETGLTICAISADSYAKTYADANGIPFVLCNGEHILPETPTTFTLTYDANGGSGAPAAQTGASEYTISTTAPVKDGYKFLGWAFDKNASFAACTGGANITLTSDTVLYAVWEKIDTPVVTTYTLSYDANGGSGAPSAQTGASEYTISTVVPVRSGYKFLGWAFDKNATSVACTGGANITLTSDTVLYAVWEKVDTPPVVTAYTLSYNANGGSGAPAAQTGSTSYTVSSVVPVRSGYKFLGWSTSATATAASYTAGKTITLTKNTVLYAVWQVVATETGKYVCPYCGEKIGEEKYEEHVQEEIILRKISVVFQNPSTTLINYGDAIVLHVDTYNLPVGSTIKWSVSNGNFAIISYSADGKSCTITPNATGDTVITATVYDAEGREVCHDTQMMSAKAGFFQKIIAFFKKLFGLTVTYPAIFEVK